MRVEGVQKGDGTEDVRYKGENPDDSDSEKVIRGTRMLD